MRWARSSTRYCWAYCTAAGLPLSWEKIQTQTNPLCTRTDLLPAVKLLGLLQCSWAQLGEDTKFSLQTKEHCDTLKFYNAKKKIRL